MHACVYACVWMNALKRIPSTTIQYLNTIVPPLITALYARVGREELFKAVDMEAAVREEMEEARVSAEFEISMLHKNIEENRGKHKSTVKDHGASLHRRDRQRETYIQTDIVLSFLFTYMHAFI